MAWGRDEKPERKEEPMGDAGKRRREAPDDRDDATEAGIVDRTHVKLVETVATARSASKRHLSLAVPFRAAERNQRVASSVLAGGLAYRLFLWLLPFGLILGGALGLADAESTEEAVASGGLPSAVVDAIGDVARAADANSWWLLAIGVPGLLWAGYTGAKAVQGVHALIWDQPPPRTEPLKDSLAFTGVVCAFLVAVALTWWFREETWLVGFLAAALTIAPLAGLWLWASLRLPHGDARWKALLPGALVVAIGFEVLHGLVVYFLVPQLEKSTSLYGGLGAVTTLIFYMYFVGRLVVTAPILNSSLHYELHEQIDESPRDATIPGGTSPG